jgi:hypothetical protein
MKHLLSLLLLASLTVQAQYPIVVTTPWSRDFLLAVSAEEARLKLGVTTGGTNSVSFEPTQFLTLSNNVTILNGALFTNAIIANATLTNRIVALDVGGRLTNTLATIEQANWLQNVTNDVQTQLNAKAATNATTLYDPLIIHPSGPSNSIPAIVDIGGTIRQTNLPAGTIDARWYGVAADGSTDDSLAINTAITNTPLGGRIELPTGVIKIDSPIYLYKPITLAGVTTSGRWDQSTNATTRLVWGGGTNYLAAIIVAGQTGSPTQSSYDIVENFSLEHFTLEPETLFLSPTQAVTSATGILLDGSNIDHSNAGFVRGGTIKEVAVRQFADHGFWLRGNVFDVNFYDSTSLNCYKHGLYEERVDAGEVNIGVARPGQINTFGCFFRSPNDGGIDGSQYAVYAEADTHLYGTSIEGGNGIALGFFNSINGGHIEGHGVSSVVDTIVTNAATGNPADGTGIQLYHQGNTISGPAVFSWFRGVRYGDESGGAWETNSMVGQFVQISYLGNNEVGIETEDGGQQGGRFPYRSLCGKQYQLD